MNGGGDFPNGPAKQLTAESLPVFNEGVYLILSRWSALQLAIEEEWAGRRSRQLADQLASDIFSWFTQTKAEPLYIDDLENVLDEGMLSLNCEIDDGSVEEVAEKLMIMHEECLEGDYNSVEKLRRAGPAAGTQQHIRQAGNDDNDDSSDDGSDDEGDMMPGSRSNMAVDSPVPQPRASSENMPNESQMEDDGWTVVSSNRNKGRRN